MSKRTADDIKKHGSISAGLLKELLAPMPDDVPIYFNGKVFAGGLPDMRGGFNITAK